MIVFVYPRTIRVSISLCLTSGVSGLHLQSPLWAKKKLTVIGSTLLQLEKEAEAKGIPVCQALNIEIPPPRPKRKPNTPYPRKPGPSSSQAPSAKLASSSQCNQAFLDLEKVPINEVLFLILLSFFILSFCFFLLVIIFFLWLGNINWERKSR